VELSLEIIELVIQNHKVEANRNRDVEQSIYNDAIPLDAGGFGHVTIRIRYRGYSQ